MALALLSVELAIHLKPGVVSVEMSKIGADLRLPHDDTS